MKKIIFNTEELVLWSSVVIGLLVLCWLVFSIPVKADEVSGHEPRWKVIDCDEDTALVTAQTLSDFAGFTAAEVGKARRVMMQITDGANDIRWSVGEAPTAAIGFKIFAAAQYPTWYSGLASELQFIEEGTDADLYVCLFESTGKP